MANKESLTDAKIRKLKAPQTEVTIRDTSGVALRHFPSGRKTFGWRYIDHHRKGSRSRIEYGDYPDLGLDHARQIHRLMVAARSNGKDILDNTVRAKIYQEVMGDAAPAKHIEGLTFQQLYERFIKEYLEKNNICKRPYNRIKNHALVTFKDDIAETIKATKIKDFIFKMREDGKKSEKTIVDIIRFINIMYAHGVEQFWINKNPFEQFNMKRKKGIRKVYYTIPELERLIRNPDNIELSDDYYLMQKAIMLSGCRRQELMLAQIKEFNFSTGIWTIPFERLKNQKQREEDQKEDLLLPMSTQLMDTIKLAIESHGNDTHIFGAKKMTFTKGTGWHRPKTGTSSERNFHNYITPYRTHYEVGHKNNHDFRRTIETILNNLGVPKDITTAMTGHSRSGMNAVYNQAKQIHILRTAFQLYADFLDFMFDKGELYQEAFEDQKPGKHLKEIYQTFNFSEYLVQALDHYGGL